MRIVFSICALAMIAGCTMSPTKMRGRQASAVHHTAKDRDAVAQCLAESTSFGTSVVRGPTETTFTQRSELGNILMFVTIAEGGDVTVRRQGGMIGDSKRIARCL